MKLEYSILIGCLSLLSFAATAGIETADKGHRDGGIAGPWKESQSFELACWQDGQRIIDEKGFGSVSLGDDMLRSSVTLRSSEGNGQTVTIVGMQRAICKIRGH
ncbi:conserved exported hypothetical protein [Gammaproteobacteria bacterium]